jgi:hypothetical protein
MFSRMNTEHPQLESSVVIIVTPGVCGQRCIAVSLCITLQTSIYNFVSQVESIVTG